jgi:hypothetical protein
MAARFGRILLRRVVIGAAMGNGGPFLRNLARPKAKSRTEFGHQSANLSRQHRAGRRRIRGWFESGDGASLIGDLTGDRHLHQYEFSPFVPALP